MNVTGKSYKFLDIFPSCLPIRLCLSKVILIFDYIHESPNQLGGRRAFICQLSQETDMSHKRLQFPFDWWLDIWGLSIVYLLDEVQGIVFYLLMPA